MKLWGNSSSGSNSAAEEGNENIPEAHKAGWEIESVVESRQDDSATQAGLGGRKELDHKRIMLEQENNKNQGAGGRIQSAKWTKQDRRSGRELCCRADGMLI